MSVMMTLLVAEGVFLRKMKGAGDPVCKTGTVSSDMFSCCPKSCGACDDGNPQCQVDDIADLEQGACCPKAIKDGDRDCDVTHPPCKLGDAYRNPPSPPDFGRHAKDDCNKAVPEHAAEIQFKTHFVEIAQVKNTGSTKSCGTYSGKDLPSVGKACLADEACIGFTTNGGAPDCLLTDYGSEEVNSGYNSYIKIKNQAGATVTRGLFEFYHPEGRSPDGAMLIHQIATGAPEYEQAESMGKVVDNSAEEAGEIMSQPNVPSEVSAKLLMLIEEDQ